MGGLNRLPDCVVENDAKKLALPEDYGYPNKEDPKPPRGRAMTTFTRRQFLQTSAALGTVAIPTLARAAAVQQNNDPFGGFTVAIQSYSYRNFQPLEKALEQIQKLGIRHVELYRGH